MASQKKNTAVVFTFLSPLSSSAVLQLSCCCQISLSRARPAHCELWAVDTLDTLRAIAHSRALRSKLSNGRLLHSASSPWSFDLQCTNTPCISFFSPLLSSLSAAVLSFSTLGVSRKGSAAGCRSPRIAWHGRDKTAVDSSCFLFCLFFFVFSSLIVSFLFNQKSIHPPFQHAPYFVRRLAPTLAVHCNPPIPFRSPLPPFLLLNKLMNYTFPFGLWETLGSFFLAWPIVLLLAVCKCQLMQVTRLHRG